MKKMTIQAPPRELAVNVTDALAIGCPVSSSTAKQISKAIAVRVSDCLTEGVALSAEMAERLCKPVAVMVKDALKRESSAPVNPAGTDGVAAPKTDMKVCTFNMCGIMAHYGLRALELVAFLESANPDVVLLSETHIPDACVPAMLESSLKDHGYKAFFKGREMKKGGGVAVLVKAELNPTSDRCFDGAIENVVIKASKGGQSLTVAAIYIPPTAGAVAFADLDSLLEDIGKFSGTKSQVIIGGDFNIDCMKIKQKLALDELLAGHGLHLAVATPFPTRTTLNSSTALDHILASGGIKTASSSCIRGFSDHDGCFVSLSWPEAGSQSVSKQATAELPKARDLSKINFKKFRKALAKLRWRKPEEGEGVESYWRMIQTNLLQVINQCAPLRKQRAKRTKNGLPRWPHQLARLAKQRNRLIDLVAKEPSAENQKRLAEVKREMRGKTKQFVYGHFFKRLKAAKGDSRKTWKVYHELLPLNKKKEEKASLSADEANRLNQFFATVGAKTAEATGQPSFERAEAIKNFGFRSILHHEVTNVAKQLPDKLSAGADEIPCKLLKWAAHVPSVADCLAMLFNLSIRTGKLPAIWKIACVTAVPKTNSSTTDDPGTFRPISITSNVLKLMERCLTVQLKAHLRRTEFLPSNQFGFRAGHSCESCLLKLVDDCRTAMDQGECVGVVGLDISKAFDSLHPDGIVASLKSAGLDDEALNWFRAYLSKRQQKVKMGLVQSECATVSHGVPQGSVLGPLLFTMYVSELPRHAANCSVVMFADDTTVYASGKTPEEVAAKLEEGMTSLSKWLKSNSLLVNATKTQYLMVSNKALQRGQPIRFGESIIEPQSTMKLLGFVLDEGLTMAGQVDAAVKKANRGIYALRMARHLIDEDGRRMMYQGVVAPHLEYCSLVSGQANKTGLNKLQVAQNKAIRAVCNAPRFASAAPLRNRIRCLDMESNRRVRMATTVWKCLNGEAPKALSALLIPLKNVHQASTRGSETMALQIPKCRTEQAKRSFRHLAATWWNELPGMFRLAASAGKLKVAVKSLLSDKGLDSEAVPGMFSSWITA